MSGIAGIIHFDGRPAEHSLIDQMTGAMAHRGPDGINHFVRGPAALGHCMLRTTPESLEEHQPLTNEDESLALVMDGRVDNWDDLRRELLSRGTVLRTRSDAELVLKAYEVWGEKCLSQIDGDFALAIWDARRRRVFCARDRTANKPFHYHWDGKTFIFASEVHAVLEALITPPVLNEGLVSEFLAHEFLSNEETFWEGCSRLAAAHWLICDENGQHQAEYWSPEVGGTLPCRTEEDFVEYYRHLLRDRVRRLSRTNAPLACEVSGGLDSSAIFAVANELAGQGRLLAPRLDGYTMAFDDDTDANELIYARAVGRHLGRTIQEVPPTRPTLQWYSQQARCLGEFPPYPNSTMALGIRTTASEQGSRVLFSGVGGDQWLCGSRTYYADALAAGDWRSLLHFVVVDGRDVGGATSAWWILRYGLYQLLPDTAKELLRKVVLGQKQAGVDTRSWLKPSMLDAIERRSNSHANIRQRGVHRIGQRGLFLILTDPFSTRAREAEERMAARCGIEIRLPFFCSDMIQFAFSRPDWLQLQGSTNRLLHRKAMKGLLPELVRGRCTKAEFTSVFDFYTAKLSEHRFLQQSSPWVSAVNLMDTKDAPVGSVRRSVRLRSLWNLWACTALRWEQPAKASGGYDLSRDGHFPHQPLRPEEQDEMSSTDV